MKCFFGKIEVKEEPEVEVTDKFEEEQIDLSVEESEETEEPFTELPESEEVSEIEESVEPEPVETESPEPVETVSQEEQKDIGNFIWIIVAIVLILLILIVIILKKKNQQKQKVQKIQEEDKEELEKSSDDDTTVLMQTEEEDCTVLMNGEEENTVLLVREEIVLVPEGTQDKSLHATSGSQIKIGRKAECDICIKNDKSVSGIHCFIWRDDEGKWVIKDNQSSNGTYLNEERVYSERTLEMGDTLEIGKTRYTFYIVKG